MHSHYASRAHNRDTRLYIYNLKLKVQDPTKQHLYGADKFNGVVRIVGGSTTRHRLIFAGKRKAREGFFKDTNLYMRY